MTTGEVGVVGLESVSEPESDTALSLVMGAGRFLRVLLAPLYLGFLGEGESGACGRLNKKDLGVSIMAPVAVPLPGERSNDNEDRACGRYLECLIMI